MRAVVLREFGGKEALELEEIEEPKPEKGEVLIDVAYAGVNPVDWKIREGYLKERVPHHLPAVLGWDLSGTVAAVGEGVSNLSVGDEVYSYARRDEIKRGTFCEKVTFDARHVVKKPKSLSLAEAASVPLAGLTAWQSLFEKANLQEKQTVLIHAGAGVVGTFAIQLARWKGAKTIITTASEQNHPYLKSLGADIMIDYRKVSYVDCVKELFSEGIDLVYDTIGGEDYQKSLALLKKGGEITSLLVPETEVPDIKTSYLFVYPSGEDLTQLARLFDEGALQPPQIHIRPLKEAAEVVEEVKTGHPTGKMVLEI